MDQLIEDTFAVADTVTLPAVAVAVLGPKVVGEGFTHIHIGTPTVYLPAARGLAMFGPSKFILSTAPWAKAAGSIGGGSSAAQNGTGRGGKAASAEVRHERS
ncbi:hypothetical protein [Streptomyces sp. SYP-A7185]|uniref:hypothetical protein n=1 Tax=Streptomyces sp. SYP-A7185 TaxID=3040076 RepID=UPI0038F7741A